MNDKLFTLEPEQEVLTDQLKQVISADINSNNGHIPFSRYMELALYHPQLGYYNNLLYKFGSQGDFVTAPLTSELFGTCISNQILELFDNQVNPDILEFGAGNGQLMLDVLGRIGRQIKKYYILELSANLVNLQKQRLEHELPECKDKVVWLSDLPQNFNGVILANEVLDAQPCELIHWCQNQVSLRGIANLDNNFVYVDVQARGEVLDIANALPVGQKSDYIAEISLSNRGFMASLNECMTRGVILLIDYGYPASEYYNEARCRGTLRGFFRQHQLDDVLIYPGLIDITSSVDFTAIATSGIDAGLDFIGYTTQANFLINCGVVSELETKEQQLGNVEYLKLSNQVNRLISPNEMGEAFKVIAFSKNIDFADFMGFSTGDKSHVL
jgi:SAM-dependent MidA family methyltransferase